MAVKKDELMVLGLAGVAVYMIVKSQGINLGAAAKKAIGGTGTGTGTGALVIGKSPATNYYSPWFGITGNTGYNLFDGALDSLGFGADNVTVGSNKGTGTGLGLSLDNSGLGMTYGGVESNGWSLFGGGASGSW
ncbi:hypothetical protein [Comamonas thiooxydans]|uniref:hypothetical protein n=1 Tax=Comamonas thiooxydans TaxID=363952 RepID=UPI00050E6872|nr:hypothetical protein [Comamonas thiooxydans]KGH20755.1 hypothetical protein P606_19445 [Comamonas thiooxydans]